MPKSTGDTAVSTESSIQSLEQLHRALLVELAGIGLVLRGSITRRFTRCGNPTCRCKADAPMLHGPYYHWTRKVAGKTVTATLTHEQATRCAEWIGNMRRLDQIVEKLQEVGLRATTSLRSSSTSRSPRRSARRRHENENLP
jgi:hypothetical protein